jgi:hypothetical protein
MPGGGGAACPVVAGAAVAEDDSPFEQAVSATTSAAAPNAQWALRRSGVADAASALNARRVLDRCDVLGRIDRLLDPLVARLNVASGRRWHRWSGNRFRGLSEA